MISDSELIAEVLSGAIDRYAELVRRYERSVRAAAWSIVGDQHAAEDLTQEVFVQAFHKLESLRTAGAFGPWLLKIARRRAAPCERRDSADRFCPWRRFLAMPRIPRVRQSQRAAK